MNLLKPTVYLTGAGPGDYKLITLKALELIKKAGCIIYDYLVNPYLLKLAKNNCELIYVGKKTGTHTLTQDKINQLLVKKAKKYNTIVRLKGGDPFIFGRGAEEALFLRRNKINFEIVPGVTSAIAAAAYAGIPLTERTKNSTVGFVTGNEDPVKKDSNINWQALSKSLGTIVFLMGVKNLPLIVKKLVESGKPKNTQVAIIRWGTTSKQKTIIGNLSNIVNLSKKNKITPPSVIVVGEVVNLRKKLNWFENKPLFGKRIIVTRTREQAGIFCEKLIDLGAEVIEIPTIKIISLKQDKIVSNAFQNNKYDWVIFTSQNGVKEFSDILERTGRDSRIFCGSKVCAIGSETSKALRQIGIKPDHIPPQFIAEELVKQFSQNKFKGKKVLILRAKKARDILPQGLKKCGLVVDTIDLYDTVIPQGSKFLLKDALKEKIDFITFTSSSTVENFIKLAHPALSNRLAKIKIASIGPITSRTVRKFGLKVHKEAKVYTIEGLVEVIAQ